MHLSEKPILIPGGLHSDARGTVSFVNGFDFKGVDRFYTIRPSRAGEPRGWIGHKRDRKWFTVVQGSVLVAVVRPDRWDRPSPDLPVERFTLSADEPAILCVPPGFATASMALGPDAILLVFSSGTIAQAAQDDYRFDIGLWPVRG